MMLDMLGDSMWFLMLLNYQTISDGKKWYADAHCQGGDWVAVQHTVQRLFPEWVHDGCGPREVTLSCRVWLFSTDFGSQLPCRSRKLLRLSHPYWISITVHDPRSTSAETRTGTAECPSAQEGPGKSVRRRKKPGFKVGLQLPIASGCQNSSDIREWAEAGCGESTPSATTLLGSNVLSMTVESSKFDVQIARTAG
jgi:hypothetical protein